MDEDLYPIGQVARRTGLSVSAVRFYSDEGIVAPAGLNSAGHRCYDLHGIAQLELIRTLRDLGAGLDEIRRLLHGETTLHHLLAEHLELVERQEHALRARRAVLRALTRQQAPAARASLMHRLVTMSDEDRERLVDEFWAEAGAGLPDGFATRPRLPDDPTAAQLEAWIELAGLLRDGEFRAAVRTYLRDTYGSGPGAQLAAGPVQRFIHTDGSRLMEQIMAAHRCGLPPDSDHARALATRLVTAAGALTGRPDSTERRQRLAEGYRMLATLPQNPPSGYDTTHGRYAALVMTINGTPRPETVDWAALGLWLATALTA
ncbi:MerR family transcriptional regulator [Actinoplanes sp. NPDC051851]|uniref:helix-turn-helix domain-containing protein n=1 Tax=Actinoplanes sp. NPDC051851 TaxID=3154753 RepID=UPI00342B5DF0